MRLALIAAAAAAAGKTRAEILGKGGGNEAVDVEAAQGELGHAWRTYQCTNRATTSR